MQRLSIGTRLDFLLRPTRPALMFALRTTFTALLALVLAVLLGLKNPYWSAMTVIVIAQPTRGMVLAKGFYRIVGTCIGGVVGVILLTLLGAQPWVLVLALAAWVGLCGMAANVLHSVRSYGAVLAAVTGVLVALLAFEHPNQAIDLGMTRFGEVLVGILVSSVVAGLLVPRADHTGLRAQARQLTIDGLRWAAEVLRHGRGGEQIRLERRLVADMAQIEGSMDQIAAGSPRLQARLPYLRGLIASMLSLMSAARAIDLHSAPAGEEPARRAERIADILAEAADRRDQPEALAAARAAVGEQRAPGPVGLYADRTQEHIAELEGALADIDADVRALREHSGEAPRGRIERHRDWPAARVTGLRAFIAAGLIGALWQLTGWAGGGPMLMTAAIMCSIFALHPRPDIGIRSSLLGASLAFLVALLARFVVLPGIDSVPLTLLLITPVLLVGTLMLANKATAIIGTELCMMFLFMSEPGQPWRHPPEYLWTLGSGIVSGVAIVTLVFALLLRTDPGRRLQSLDAEIRHDLQELAGARGLPAAQRWRARAYHRVLRLVMRAVLDGREPEAAIDSGLAALAIGNALLRLQQLLRQQVLPAAAAQVVAEALAELRTLGRDPARAAVAARAAAGRLADIEPPAALGEHARLALLEIAAGLAVKRGLFRGAPVAGGETSGGA